MLCTHTAQMGTGPMGILQTAATTGVAFIVDFFKTTNEILKQTNLFRGLLLEMKSSCLNHVLNFGMNVWSLM